MLNNGNQPPVDAVRAEEFINYFDYDYPIPTKEEVFSVYTEVASCPWNEKNQLLHIGLKGFTVPIEELAPSNLVFLIDVSGSMEDDNKLPLLKKSFKMMVDRLNERDRVSIVTYAGEERLVLGATSCEQKDLIKSAIDNLASGGSTNGEGGIEMAYNQAQKGFVEGGNNRVILATDGDFNIGRSSGGELTRLIESKRDLGVYLTILGFGMGNYKDAKMESLTNHGNGNYFYIDEIGESNHVLVKNLAGTLMTIAKDVKIQVEFNPNTVAEYRLIGYENRLLNAEDFEDDQKDAGELGAGHTVTAIYEIVPGKADKGNLRYQNQSSNNSSDLGTVMLRFKRPDKTKSEYREVSVRPNENNWKDASKDFRFSASVAAFSMILKSSKYINEFTLEDVANMAKNAFDVSELDRMEFLGLVEKAGMTTSD
jgi:Ca-activated chloride channel family protein